jgi:hypothetical protein
MSDSSRPKDAQPEGCDENGPAGRQLPDHVSIQTCSFVASGSRPAAAGPTAHFDHNATTPVTDLVH